MGSFLDRKLFSNTSKHQARIIRLAVIPSFIFCALITLFCIEFRHEILDLILYGTRMLTLHIVDRWVIPILIVLWSGFVFIAYTAYRISLEMVGPFTRINRELDMIIRGETRHHIKVRDEDELAFEVLERINILIDNLPPPKTPLKVR